MRELKEAIQKCKIGEPSGLDDIMVEQIKNIDKAAEI